MNAKWSVVMNLQYNLSTFLSIVAIFLGSCALTTAAQPSCLPQPTPLTAPDTGAQVYSTNTDLGGFDSPSAAYRGIP